MPSEADAPERVKLAALSDAMRKARDEADSVFGVRWADLEEVSRHELVIANLIEAGSLTRTPSEAVAKVERLREALRQIIATNQTREWTATPNNPETHWETGDGPYAKIARTALKEQS